MKRRSTFVHDPEVEVDPNQLRFSGKKFAVEGVKAAREERLTFGFNELPQELWQVLRQSHELHIRWTSEQRYHSTAPWLSRISPGLHVSYTPLKEGAERTNSLLCPMLHKIFSDQLRCSSPSETFSSPSVISDRFASTSSLHYHSLLPNLRDLVSYIQQKICPHSDISCLHSAPLLNLVDSLDIDYDSISHALTFTAFWSKPPALFYDPLSDDVYYNSWTSTFDGATNKAEVGILSPQPASDPSELQLSGLLTVAGEDDHPLPTLFSFPSRHHTISPPQTYNISFARPTGLHPTLSITFPSASALRPLRRTPPSSTCALHTFLTLPSALFADKYQLSTTDPLFLSTHRLKALHSISGATDLEAPDYAVPQWGSAILLELASPPTNDSPSSSPWTVTIPLHLRYLPPSPSGYASISIPWPPVFWACTEDEGTKFPTNPFDRVNLGYDGLFGPRTMFYHLDPAPAPATAPTAGGRIVEEITVPVLDTEAVVPAQWIEAGTLGAVVLGFVWVVWKLGPGLRNAGKRIGGSGMEKEKREKGEKKVQ